MVRPDPVLTQMIFYHFPISHFSEKARWALDHHDLAYRDARLIPGLHMAVIRGLKLKRTWVPILVLGKNRIQGSGAIIDQAELLGGGRSLMPPAESDRRKVTEWEARLDDDVGVALRNALYSVLIDDARLLRRVWTYAATPVEKLAMVPLLPVVQWNLPRYYRLTPTNVAACQARFDRLTHDLDAHLEDNDYLVGNTFTRADITAAALLAPLVQPAGHPFPYELANPDSLAPYVARYEGRPFWRYVERLYRDHRPKTRAEWARNAA